VADEVKKRGEEAVLDALPAFERRIVHKALSDYEGVSTYSEGEEPNRRVVIAPAE
jgi:spoIIIJ-associated protein